MRETHSVTARTKLRRIALARQGLTKARPFGHGREGALRALEHLGYIQIDTISVIERAHHHTLWTRVPSYQPNYLNDLVQSRQAYEYWSHAASFQPMREFRFSLPRMADARRGQSPYAKADPKVMRRVRDRIQADGPHKARDFDSGKKRAGTWWDWKPAKRALEQLFIRGELMITARDGMEKVYDLTERVLPDSIDTRTPTVAEYADFLVHSSLRAHGFTTLKQLAHLLPGSTLRKALLKVLNQRIDAGTVTQLTVDGQPPVYLDCAALDEKLTRPAPNVRLLSPFDNAVIHRSRIAHWFDFDYRLECYVPQAKRQYGYFCLPILYRDELVGRVDCKAHRATRRLDVVHLHLHIQPAEIDAFTHHFAKSVQRFAVFNQCDTVSVSKVSPRRLTRIVKTAMELLS